jgi:hypothetical protein
VRRVEGTHQGLFEDLIPAQTSEVVDTKTNIKSNIRLDDGPGGIPASEEKPGVAQSPKNKPPTDTNLAVDVYAPWDIKSIQEGLGGRYDRETIIDMLQKCRGDIDRAFAALLDEKADDELDKKFAPTIPVKPSLQASRDTSPFSTGSKRSADDSDDSEDPQPARRVRPKRRFPSNLTLGVGISFRDDQDEVVSLNLRVSGPSSNLTSMTLANICSSQMPSGNEQGQATDPSPIRPTSPDQSDVEEKKCRRSGRLSRPRPT